MQADDCIRFFVQARGRNARANIILRHHIYTQQNACTSAEPAFGFTAQCGTRKLDETFSTSAPVFSMANMLASCLNVSGATDIPFKTHEQQEPTKWLIESPNRKWNGVVEVHLLPPHGRSFNRRSRPAGARDTELVMSTLMPFSSGSISVVAWDLGYTNHLKEKCTASGIFDAKQSNLIPGVVVVRRTLFNLLLRLLSTAEARKTRYLLAAKNEREGFLALGGSQTQKQNNDFCKPKVAALFSCTEVLRRQRK